MNHMVNLFGETFNKKGVTAATGLNLKYARAYYRDNFQNNHKYERSSMVPEKEWKALIEDAKEKALRKQGKTKAIEQEGMVRIIFFLLLNIFKLQYLTYLQPFISSLTHLKQQRHEWKKCAAQTGPGWISQVKGTNCKNHLIIICSQQLIVFSKCIKQLIDLSQELYMVLCIAGKCFSRGSH